MKGKGNVLTGLGACRPVVGRAVMSRQQVEIIASVMLLCISFQWRRLTATVSGRSPRFLIRLLVALIRREERRGVCSTLG
jgi:hypothetical protein